MSMETYIIKGYGLWVADIKKLKIDIDDLEEYDTLRFDEQTESITLCKLGKDGIDWNNEITNYDNGILLFAQKTSSIFKAAYNSPEEMADEFKKSYGKYLPKNYNYIDNLVYGECTIWG